MRQNVAGGPQYPLEFTVLRALKCTVIQNFLPTIFQAIDYSTFTIFECVHEVLNASHALMHFKDSPASRYKLSQLTYSVLVTEQFYSNSKHLLFGQLHLYLMYCLLELKRLLFQLTEKNIDLSIDISCQLGLTATLQKIYPNTVRGATHARAPL